MTATVCLTLGLIWQFVLAMLILRREEGSVGPRAMVRRLWLRSPRDPATGRPRRRLWWLLVPLGVVFTLDMLFLAPVIEGLQLKILPMLEPLPFQEGETLFSLEAAPRMEGAWWFMTLSVFNVFLARSSSSGESSCPGCAGCSGAGTGSSTGCCSASTTSTMMLGLMRCTMP